ncbi:MAG: DUF1501 domain-containing protein [Fuerstiella sp.]|jgi:hypothetical protein|nr:DUF1501 domain-containing protein [Fuerstiella sp.]
MLKITDSRRSQFHDRITRRSFLRAGTLGVSALHLSDLLQGAEVSGGVRRDHSVVMIYLPGGPTQHETFDPKPRAPREIRGSFQPISTAVPGTQFCELLPKLSAMSDRFSIVRSLVGLMNRHESFQCYTGRPAGRPGDNEPAGGWPSLGSTVSSVLGPNREGMIPYVDAAPRMGHMPYNNRGVHDPASTLSWPGYTGSDHVPFTIEGDVKDDLILNGIDSVRLQNRRSVLTSLGRLQQQVDARCGLDAFQQQAFGLLTSSKLADALDLEKEDPAVVLRYGEGQATDPSFGGAPQSPKHLLLARRLVEAGVRCVTVAFGAWDWHANREGTIEYLSRKYLPVYDHALSTFLQDLEQRGLLETTSVVVWGEFGRTPRINAKGGRDHWAETQSVLLAGGGIHGGMVIGQTDKEGGRPVERPVHVQEVFATLYRTLGIDVNNIKINDLNGRPRYLIDENRQPISELFS